MTTFLNIILGFIPAVILAASISAGIEDDASHRRVYLLVYGLWAFTLAGWNWLESAHAAWIALWLVFGVVALTMWATRSRRTA